MNEQNTKKKDSKFVLTLALAVCSAVFFLMFFLSLSVWQASGSFRVISFLMREDTRGSNDMFEALSLDRNSAGELRGRLEEMFVRYYVEMRETNLGDKIELRWRWGVGGPVHMLSTDRVFNKFKPTEEEMAKLQDGPQRTIDILSVRKMKEGLYDVMFDVYEERRGNRYRQRKTMSLKYTYSPAYRVLSSNFSNPFGMVFTDVNITRVKQ